MSSQIFDFWPTKYEAWFQTPMGRLVKSIELSHILEMLAPCSQDDILDVGCGTGIFTETYCQMGAKVTGIDLSFPMLQHAGRKQDLIHMQPVVADMGALPFSNGSFNKTVSITALEFVSEASQAIQELLRVTRKGGLLVIATLNSLSSWATQRRQQAQEDPASVFRKVHFRSPQELKHLVGLSGTIRTAIHFDKDAHLEQARIIENRLKVQKPDDGAFVIGAWRLP